MYKSANVVYCQHKVCDPPSSTFPKAEHRPTPQHHGSQLGEELKSLRADAAIFLIRVQPLGKLDICHALVIFAYVTHFVCDYE